jgi:hypothetical protein
MNWSLVVAVNSEEVLRTNLLRSVELKSAKEIVRQYKSGNASSAYNNGLAAVTGDIVVFAHQDVYLPVGWAAKLKESLDILTLRDPEWGVAGVFGITANGGDAGYVYSSGLRRFIGRPFHEPIRVSTLDEMLLIIRKSSGLQFDEHLPGFHLYGTDICLSAESRGMRNYVVPCFAFHNSCGVVWLPLDFWRAYLYLRRKWKARLPVMTPCTRITLGCIPIYEDIVRRCFSKVRGRNMPGCRVAEPDLYYAENILPILK